MDFVAATRYARAIFQAAEHAGILDRVAQDFDRLQAQMDQEPRTRFLLVSPMIQSKAKEKIADLLGEKLGMDPTSVRSLKVVAGNGRAVLLPLILSKFRKMRDQHDNRVRVDAAFAHEPTPESVKSLAAALEGILKKHVVCEPRVDPDLLGGIRLKIEDTIIDGSLRYQLSRLRQEVESRRLPAG